MTKRPIPEHTDAGVCNHYILITHLHKILTCYTDCVLLSWWQLHQFMSYGRYTGLILGLHPANERRRYFVTTSHIAGWKSRISHDIAWKSIRWHMGFFVAFFQLSIQAHNTNMMIISYLKWVHQFSEHIRDLWRESYQGHFYLEGGTEIRAETWNHIHNFLLAVITHSCHQFS